MHRNTYLLISVLSVIAALVIGINMGRRFGQSLAPSPLPTQRQEASISATKSYRNTFCNVAFDYPGSFTLLESASGSAAFTGSAKDDGILLTCQKDIPRPAVDPKEVDVFYIGSVSAQRYHTISKKDGTQIDAVIFRHQGTKLDVFLAGTGEIFQKLISSIILL